MQMNAFEGSTLPVAPCATSCVNVLCVCASLRSLLSFAISSTCKGESGGHIPSMGRDPRSPGMAPAAGQEQPWAGAAGGGSHTLMSLNRII